MAAVQSWIRYCEPDCFKKVYWLENVSRQASQLQWGLYSEIIQYNTIYFISAKFPIYARYKLLMFLIFWHYFGKMFSNIGLKNLNVMTCSKFCYCFRNHWL